MSVVGNVADTVKLVVGIGILATKLLGSTAYFIATWEEKLGIGDKIAGMFLRSFKPS
jgi:hypothetical protein